MSKSGDYNLSEIKKRDDMIAELVEALQFLLDATWHDLRASDDAEVVKARAAIDKAKGL